MGAVPATLWGKGRCSVVLCSLLWPATAAVTVTLICLCPRLGQGAAGRLRHNINTTLQPEGQVFGPRQVCPPYRVFHEAVVCWQQSEQVPGVSDFQGRFTCSGSATAAVAHVQTARCVHKQTASLFEADSCPVLVPEAQPHRSSHPSRNRACCCVLR